MIDERMFAEAYLFVVGMLFGAALGAAAALVGYGQPEPPRGVCMSRPSFTIRDAMGVAAGSIEADVAIPVPCEVTP